MSNKILITSLGWEPRFLSGLDQTLASELPNQIIVFKPLTFFQQISDVVKSGLNDKAARYAAECRYYEFNNGDHVETWHTAGDALEGVSESDEIVLDITTMPRYLIWACLHNFDVRKVKFKCVYFPPASYGEWLSADTGKPQMVFRHSGLAYPDLPTCLLLFAGFDLSRAQHFVDFFEPKKIILITQVGAQLNNDSRCVGQLRGGASIHSCKLDAYSNTLGLKDQLVELVKSYLEDYNIVATTVGPRPSTLALYALNRELPSVGLVHANAHQYNENYSSEINVSAKFESVVDFS